MNSEHKGIDTLPKGLPEHTLGWGVAEWVMSHLRQPNGKNAGKPFRFTQTQLRFLLWFYAIDENGRFIYQRAIRRLAKGSGKSPMAAVLAVAEFLGPVRFKRYNQNVRGGVEGKPVHMPWVQIVATSEAQTENTMRIVRALLPKGSKVVDKYSLDIGRQTMFKPPEGKLQVVTSSASTLEGAEATFVIGDETEHWLPSNGGHDLESTIADNLAKSGSRMVETCNAWKPGLESVAELGWKSYEAQQEGKTREMSTLYDARIAAPDTDMSDPVELRKALEWVYGDCWWVDIDAVISRIYDPRSDPDDSKRKYFNQPTSLSSAWCDWQSWAAIANPDELIEPGEEITLGFDGSLSDDSTALIACRVSDGYVFPVHVWEPRESGEKVNVEEVDDLVARTFDTFDVKAFFCDVAYWESYVKVIWPKRHGTEVETWARKGGKDPLVFGYDLRGNSREWTLSVELVRDEIRERQFHHDDNPILSRHVLNSMSYPNRWGTAIRKKTKDSPDKIDANVAMILARLARRMYLAEHEGKRKRTGRVI